MEKDLFFPPPFPPPWTDLPQAQALSSSKERKACLVCTASPAIFRMTGRTERLKLPEGPDGMRTCD